MVEECGDGMARTTNKRNGMRVIRCRMLDRDVTFAYCRKGGNQPVGEQLPCREVITCWFDKFAVAEFLRQHYGENVVSQLAVPPSPKLATLIDLAQKSRPPLAENEQPS
jgi:hypothetical protein